MPGGSANTRFWDVRVFDEVPSTNSVAAEIAQPGLVVVAGHQTAGRGRLGRTWEAPPRSSLLVSVVLDVSWVWDGRPQLATVALALAASDACGPARPQLKWPNDLVVGDGKVGGILAETVPGAGVIVAGLGLNVRWGGAAPPPPGVSFDALGVGLDPVAVLDDLLRILDARLDQDVDLLLDDYRARSATLGRQVRIESPGGDLEGTAVEITSEGHLLVQDDGGEMLTVAAGDVVHLRAG
jgi:BirA family biotin operon repressor/biotin-[acetyl-CoA-carboxylase] ligase